MRAQPGKQSGHGWPTGTCVAKKQGATGGGEALNQALQGEWCPALGEGERALQTGQPAGSKGMRQGQGWDPLTVSQAGDPGSEGPDDRGCMWSLQNPGHPCRVSGKDASRQDLDLRGSSWRCVCGTRMDANDSSGDHGNVCDAFYILSAHTQCPHVLLGQRRARMTPLS